MMWGLHEERAGHYRALKGDSPAQYAEQVERQAPELLEQHRFTFGRTEDGQESVVPRSDKGSALEKVA